MLLGFSTVPLVLLLVQEEKWTSLEASGLFFQTISCMDVRVTSHHSGIAEEVEDGGED